MSRLDHGSWVNAVAFSPDGDPGGHRQQGYSSARVFDAATGAQVSRLDHGSWVNGEAFNPDDDWVHAVAFSPDEHPGGHRQLAMASARVFDAATGTEMSRLDHDDTVRAVAFSPDGTRVATGSKRYRQRAGVRRGDRRRAIPPGPRRHRVDAVAFSPDGTRVATGSCDQAARGCSTRRPVNEVSRLDHDDIVTAVAFSPDGTRVATGSKDGSARVFDAATGTERCRLDHDEWVYAVAFSPDGTLVATGSGARDGSARVWVVDHNQLIEQAEGRLTRNLTQQEWRRYFRDKQYRQTRADLP